MGNILLYFALKSISRQIFTTGQFLTDRVVPYSLRLRSMVGTERIGPETSWSANSVCKTIQPPLLGSELRRTSPVYKSCVIIQALSALLFAFYENSFTDRDDTATYQ